MKIAKINTALPYRTKQCRTNFCVLVRTITQVKQTILSVSY